MRPVFVFIALIWLTSLPLLCTGAEALSDFGPLYDQFPLTLAPGERTEAAGPLFSSEHEGTRSSWALSPVMSLERDTGPDSFEFDFFYPLLTYHRFGLDYRLQFTQLFSVSGGPGIEAAGTKRVSVFPFYFQQRSPDPSENYTALIPFYGHLKNRFFRDEISFVMLPAYVQTRKKDVVTDNYLVPFFDVRRGDALRGWQFWPLIGREHKDVTTRTNQYDETEVIGGHDKLFVLWPLFFRNDLGVGTTNAQTQRLLLPFYSIQRSPLRDSTSYLWPLGYTCTEDREKHYREWALPWPLVDFARGEGKTANRVWPLFSQAKTPNLESDFFLWPIYKYNRVHSEALDRGRTRILFFLYSDVIEKNTIAGTSLQRTDLWPLFTARRDHDGNERLQLLAPIEPFLPSHPGIERNYSPLWSFWRSEKNRKTGMARQSFLWNLYRRETTPKSRKCSLLFGILHYESGIEGTHWRIFHFPLGKSAQPAAPSSGAS